MRRLRQLEGKVATLSVINDALQKENDTLREVRGSSYMLPPAALPFMHRCSRQAHRRGDRVIEQWRQPATRGLRHYRRARRMGRGRTLRRSWRSCRRSFSAGWGLLTGPSPP